MSTHAKLSASGSKRWINCPESVQQEEQFPDVENEYALYGTEAHKLAEHCLTNDLDTHEYYKDRPGIEVDNEMIAGVQEYLDHVRSLEDECFIEQRVDFSPWVPSGFGTADFVCIDDNTLTVVDLKFGKGVKVFAEDNTQGIIYALGTLKEFGFLFDIKIVKIVIVQPRLDHIDEWELSIDDLKKWEEVIRKKAEIALSDDAPLIPGEEQCRIFKAKGSCKALAEDNVSAAAKDFEEIGAPVDLKEVHLLNNEEVGKLLEQTSLFSDWIKALESYAVDEMLAGREMPGFKLVEGRSLRTWKDETTAIEELKKLKLKKSDLFIEKFISPAQAEKLFKQNKLDKERLDSLITKPPGKTTFAPESDKRPAVKPDAITDFRQVA